jgi:hypothetical protein
MALTTTTLSAACNPTDVQISVTAATNFAAGNLVQIDNEFMAIANSYVSGTKVPVRRGINGTTVSTLVHPSGANATTGTGSDFASPNASVIAAYALSARRRRVTSYSAAGAIDLPTAGEDVVAILNGATGFDYTVAAPGKDLDGSLIVILSNVGATSNTVTFTGGLSGAGSSYDKITFNSTAPVCVTAYAANGLWISPSAVAIAGTVTSLIGTIG